MKLYCFVALLLMTGLSCASNRITDLYETGQGNIVLTSIKNNITNQYLYSPYGIQNNLFSNAKSITTHNTTAPQLFSHIRKPLDLIYNRFGYTGQANDPSTSLMMLGRFRDYAPSIGRFIQPDTDNSFSSKHINNLFAYVISNPISHTDPTGHNWMPSFLDEISLDIWHGGNTIIKGLSSPIESVATTASTLVGELETPLAPLKGLLDEAAKINNPRCAADFFLSIIQNFTPEIAQTRSEFPTLRPTTQIENYSLYTNEHILIDQQVKARILFPGLITCTPLIIEYQEVNTEAHFLFAQHTPSGQPTLSSMDTILGNPNVIVHKIYYFYPEDYGLDNGYRNAIITLYHAFKRPITLGKYSGFFIADIAKGKLKRTLGTTF